MYAGDIDLDVPLSEHRYTGKATLVTFGPADGVMSRMDVALPSSSRPQAYNAASALVAQLGLPRGDLDAWAAAGESDGPAPRSSGQW